ARACAAPLPAGSAVLVKSRLRWYSANLLRVPLFFAAMLVSWDAEVDDQKVRDPCQGRRALQLRARSGARSFSPGRRAAGPVPSSHGSGGFVARRPFALFLLLTAPACRSGSRSPAVAGTAPAVAAVARVASLPRFEIAYRLSVPDPASHYYEIQMDVAHVSGDTIRLQMPVWSPGRYARFDFARNLEDLSITREDGRPVPWDRENGSLWRVYPDGANRLTVRYRVFANTLSGTFSVADTAHANWNGASLFLYVVHHKPDPVTLHVQPPAGWHILNGDTRTPDQTDYAFENYDRLIDSPTEVARSFLVDSFTVDGRRYRTMVHHNGPASAAARRRFVGDVEKLVRYENTVFGPPPLEMYTFLFNIGYPGGDGMEHLFSTQIISAAAWSDTAALLSGIGSAAHEYFHVWNVKRVRPLLLGPFDYAHERYQPSLWVAEGWTQYYGQMALYRAGILPREGLYAMVANSIVRPNLTSPGRTQVSPRMASFVAPFWDGASPGYAVDRSAFFSYYTQGAGRALYLDLLIRARSLGARALDDAFRNLRRLSWEQPNASYYLQGRGYTEADVERAASEAAGEDLHDWFTRYVGGTADVNFDEALGWAGLRLVRSPDRWTLAEIPGATAAQRAVREGWITGRVDR
ncbi:MAG TPA: hypothetical protein VJU87_08655, partial [Gemmatimonadaceae bacterium]|nr:hypothetical protein [Gemmatimonadaceae bacterium]